MKLVMVSWADARGVHEQWIPLEDMRGGGVYIVQSVGWIVEETKKYVHLCPHLGTDPDLGCGDMVIPKSAIVKRVRLKP